MIHTCSISEKCVCLIKKPLCFFRKVCFNPSVKHCWSNQVCLQMVVHISAAPIFIRDCMYFQAPDSWHFLKLLQTQFQ